MALTETIRNALTGSLLGRTAYTAPATLYAGLIVGATDQLSGGAEVSGGSYARVEITNNTANFPTPSGGITTNANVITWPTSSAAWGSVNAVRLFDAASGGNLVGGALLDPAATVDATGITVSIAATQLSLTIFSTLG
jgi:hypothetical protein